MLIFIMIVHLHFCHLLPTLLPPLSCHSHSVTLANRLYSCFFIFSILTFFFWTNQSQTIPSVLLKQLEIIFQLLHSLGSSVGNTNCAFVGCSGGLTPSPPLFCSWQILVTPWEKAGVSFISKLCIHILTTTFLTTMGSASQQGGNILSLSFNWPYRL